MHWGALIGGAVYAPRISADVLGVSTVGTVIGSIVPLVGTIAGAIITIINCL